MFRAIGNNVLDCVFGGHAVGKDDSSKQANQLCVRVHVSVCESVCVCVCRWIDNNER